MTKNYFMGLVLAVSFLAAVKVQADVISVVPAMTTIRADYFDSVGPSEWAFESFRYVGDNKADNVDVREVKYAFDITNTLTADVVGGTFTASGVSGWGDNLTATVDGATVTLAHPNARSGIMSFAVNLADLDSGKFMNSFYLDVAKQSSDAGGVSVIATYWDSSTGSMMQLAQSLNQGGFAGFILDEDSYFTEIRINVVSANGSNGSQGFNGLVVGFGNGEIDGGASFFSINTTPEPATFVMLGFGLAGLGLATRRRNKK